MDVERDFGAQHGNSRQFGPRLRFKYGRYGTVGTSRAEVLCWAGRGRYRKWPEYSHRIFLLVLLGVVRWYVSGRTWGARRGRGMVCEMVSIGLRGGDIIGEHTTEIPPPPKKAISNSRNLSTARSDGSVMSSPLGARETDTESTGFSLFT